MDTVPFRSMLGVFTFAHCIDVYSNLNVDSNHQSFDLKQPHRLSGSAVPLLTTDGFGSNSVLIFFDPGRSLFVSEKHWIMFD